MPRYFFVLVLALVIFSVSTGVLRAADITIEEIAAAWKGAEERMPSGRITWSGTRTMSAGYILSEVPGQPPGPPEKTVLESKHTLDFEGTKVVHQREEEFWSNQRGIFVRVASFSWDGATAKSLESMRSLDPQEKLSFVPVGIVEQTDKATRLQDVGLLPLRQALRPSSPAWTGRNPEELEVVDQSVEIDGRRTVQVETARARRAPRKVDNVVQFDRYWLNPEHDFRVVRYERLLNDTLSYRIDIQYQDDNNVPKAWTLRMDTGPFGARRLGEVYEATVTEYDLGIDFFETGLEGEPSHFDITFPPDARVVDKGDRNKRLEEQERLRRERDQRVPRTHRTSFR